MKHRGWLLVAVLGSAVALTGCGKKERAPVEMKVNANQVFADPVVAQLAEAAASGDVATITQLLQGGANPSAVGDKGTSLLQWAMLNKSKAGFEALLAGGADPKHTDETGDTVMHYAAKANDPAYLDVLLPRGLEVDVANSVTGQTPLMAALMGERPLHFQKLLAAGANPNKADRAGNTSLHVAAKINENQRVLELLHAGADPTLKNRQGVSFLRYLNMTATNILSDDARRQRENVMAWLREHKVHLDDMKPG